MQEIQEVLNNLKNDNWRIRKNTIENLLSYPEDLYLPILEDWLRNDDALLRNIAMETFRALGPKAVKTLISLLKEEDADIRIFSASILGDIKDALSAPSLITALNDADVNVRIASAESLGKIGDERAINALERAMGDASSWVAMAAIEAIGEIGGERAFSVLCKCLEKEEYRGIAFDAIEKMGDHHFISYLTPFVDRKDDLRELALKAIVNIADVGGMKPMPVYFMSLIPMLIEMQQSRQPELRRAAFIALSWSEDIRGLPHFINALNDEDLQEYAIKGLISLGKKAVPGIIDALEGTDGNRGMLAKALSMLGGNNALIRFAQDNDPEVRAEVALAMGSLKTSRAREVILLLQHDEVEEVRAAAKLSLAKVETETAQ